MGQRAFALSWAGAFDPATAFSIAQTLAMSVPAYFGARIGWRVRGSVASALVGVGITGGLGLAISLLKQAIH